MGVIAVELAKAAKFKYAPDYNFMLKKAHNDMSDTSCKEVTNLLSILPALQKSDKDLPRPSTPLPLFKI